MIDDSFESELLTITDEDGQEHELEVLGTMEYNDRTYYLFVPANIDEMDVNDPDYGYIILEAVIEDNEEVFLSIEDDDELQDVYEMFMALMVDEEDEADGESEE